MPGFHRFSPTVPLLFAACWSGPASRESADQQVYPILARVVEQETGEHKAFRLERPVDTLRARLLAAKARDPVTLSLLEALDVAAENSRDFQRQKELLYLAALDLTRSEHDFAFRFAGGGAAEISGTDDDNIDVTLRDDLSGSVNSAFGTRIVASFVNTFLRSVLSGGGFDGSSILDLTLTQPLLAGAGRRIAREPLTQAERDVVYAVRTFERFRNTFAVRVVSDYYDVVRQQRDLRNVEANHNSLRQSREQIEELYRAGRRTIVDLGRAQQSEYSASAQGVGAQNRLHNALDRFKQTLGLPVTAPIELDPGELDRLATTGVEPLALDEGTAVAIARQRRYDHRTTIDTVEDTGRRILVAEDALGMALDFTAALNVPAASGKSLDLDWSRVNWSAGFDLDLALDKLVERNAYRAALIAFDAAVRAREASDDTLALEVRNALRNIQSAIESHRIQTEAVRLAEQRVEATTDLYAADRVTALEKLDAQDSLLQTRLDLTAAIVDYAVARLELMRDLEGLQLEPQGLRYDPALPLPALRDEPAMRAEEQQP